MAGKTKDKLLDVAKQLFTLSGYEGLSMRSLATTAGVSLSVTYHHFQDKDELLKRLFKKTSRELGEYRSELPKRSTAVEMLRDRIEFQIDHAEDVVFILKYYLHYRGKYLRNATGFLPPKAYLHISEVLEYGVKTGEFTLENPIEQEAKVVAHAINGFLLEYYPISPYTSEREELISSIHGFVVRALTGSALAKA